VAHASYETQNPERRLERSPYQPRSAILERARYEVVPALNHIDVQTACEKHRDFDLVIVGHSIPKQEKRRMLQTVRECRGHVPLSELYPQGSIPVESSAFFASSEVALFRLPHFCSTILHTLA